MRLEVKPVFKEKIDLKKGQSPLTPQTFAKNR